MFRDVDAYVRSTDSVDTGFGEQRAPSPVAVLDTILKVKGVSAAVGDMQSYAELLPKTANRSAKIKVHPHSVASPR